MKRSTTRSKPRGISAPLGHAWFCLFALCSPPVARAGPVETAIVAAMKLPDAPNYSWVSEVDDDARSYRITGATERQGDFSRVTLPVVVSLRRRMGLGAGNSDNVVTAIYRGEQHLVLEVEGGWKTIDELPAPTEPPTVAGTGKPDAGAPGGSSPASAPPVKYSNLQLTLSRPHHEIAIIIASATDMKAEPDGVSGVLGDVGARLLLVHPGQNELTPLQATGDFRLWIENGALTRYSVRLAGQIAVQAKSGRREIKVSQNATTRLHRVGATTFVVPDEARRKLGK